MVGTSRNIFFFFLIRFPMIINFKWQILAEFRDDVFCKERKKVPHSSPKISFDRISLVFVDQVRVNVYPGRKSGSCEMFIRPDTLIR